MFKAHDVDAANLLPHSRFALIEPLRSHDANRSFPECSCELALDEVYMELAPFPATCPFRIAA